MIEKYWLEFSKIYARLMRLELTIKHNAYLAIKEHYGENALNEFIKFFQNKRRQQRYTNDRKNKLDYIINHPQKTQLQKMKLLINELYLSDMLNLILKTTQFKIKEIDEIFYNKIPKKYIFPYVLMASIIDSFILCVFLRTYNFQKIIYSLSFIISCFFLLCNSMIPKNRLQRRRFHYIIN